MGLQRYTLVGLVHPNRNLDRIRRGNGQLFRRMELGLGCRGNPLRPARTRGRSDSAYCRVLPRSDGPHGRYGVGVGYGCLGRDEVFQTC